MFGSYIDFPVWMKNKTTTVNLINKKCIKCFQYSMTVALNHKQIKKDPRKIKTIKLFIGKYNWEGINYPSEKDNWKKIEKGYLTIALNLLFNEKEKVYPTYVLKHNSSRKRHVILLMTPNREGWYYIELKNYLHH